MTLDGKIATRSGKSKWITGEEARKRVHADRQRYAAIMVGVNTVIKDDPLLTCRLDSFESSDVEELQVVDNPILRICLKGKWRKTRLLFEADLEGCADSTLRGFGTFQAPLLEPIRIIATRGYVRHSILRW